MASRTGVVSTAPIDTTTATTTPWPLPAFPGGLRLHALPRFGLEALYRNQRRSTVKDGTCLKIMVSPVRVRVPPLLFSSNFQEKLLAIFERLCIECRFYHNHYHNGHSLKVPREEVVEAHGGLVVHGGGDVGVGIGCLPHRGVPEHLRDQLQLFLVLEHECGEGVPKVIEPDIRQACLLKQRLVGAAVEVVPAHNGAGSRREDKPKVAPEPSVANPLLVLSEAVFLEGLVGDREQFQSPAGGGLRLLPYNRPALVLGDRAANRQRTSL